MRERKWVPGLCGWWVVSFRDLEACAFSGGPWRFNFYDVCFSGQVVTKTRPSPLFGARYQAASYGIAVKVAELLDALVRRTNIEIVIPGEPERMLTGLFGDRGLESLYRQIECSSLWFGDEEMDAFRHNYITEHVKDIAPSDLFQCSLE